MEDHMISSINKASAEILLDFLIKHQTNFMLFLEGVCITVAFMTLITKNFSRSRKITIFLLELNSELFLVSNRLFYLYKDSADERFRGLVRSMKFMEYLQIFLN